MVTARGQRRDLGVRGPLPADFTYQARRHALAELAGWCAGVRKRRDPDGTVVLELDTPGRGDLTFSRLELLQRENPAAYRAACRMVRAQLKELAAAVLRRVALPSHSAERRAAIDRRRSALRDATARARRELTFTLAYTRALSGWRQPARRPLLRCKRTPRQRARRAARRGACRAGPGGDPDPDDPSCGGRRRWGCRGGRWPQRVACCASRPVVCGEFIRASFEPGLTPGLRPHVEVWALVGRTPAWGCVNRHQGGQTCML